jgi:hypothetical protein
MKNSLLIILFLVSCTPKVIVQHDACPVDSVYIHDTTVIVVDTILHDSLSTRDTILRQVDHFRYVYKQVAKMDTVIHSVNVVDTVLKFNSVKTPISIWEIIGILLIGLAVGVLVGKVQNIL